MTSDAATQYKANSVKRQMLYAGAAAAALVWSGATFAQAGVLDGTYADLAERTEAAEAVAAAAMATSETAAEALNAAQEALAALRADLSDEENVLLEAVFTAQEGADATQTALQEATAARDEASGALSDAQTARADVLQMLADARTAAANAQTAFDNDPSGANFGALDEAREALEAAQTAADESQTVVEPFQEAFDAAEEVVTMATAANTEAQTAVTAALTAAGTVMPSLSDLEAADENRVAAQEASDVATAALGAANGDVAAFARVDAIFTAAADSGNQAIADAAGALTGTSTDTNYEVEVVAALTDHEGRITGNTAAISAEEAARIAADEALGTRIGAEEAARIAADNVLRDRISSSTATAIALGGTAILPNVNFTLSGNVGFYEGAQAIAVTGAGRVAPNTYLTGAVGGGLNKRGSVGGRVGVIFGF